MPPPDEYAGPERRAAAPSEVRLSEETGAWLESKIAAAVREGMKGTVTEESVAVFWSVGLKVLQKQATQQAGRFVLGSLWGLARKVLLFFTVGGLVYAVGGWALLAKFLKAMFSSGQP